MSWPQGLVLDLIRLRRRQVDYLSYEVWLCYDDSEEQTYMGELDMRGEPKMMFHGKREFTMQDLHMVYEAYKNVLAMGVR